MRTLALPEAVKHWSLTSLKEKLIKIGAKIVTHARYVIFQMAEVAVPKELFQDDIPDRPVRPPRNSILSVGEMPVYYLLSPSLDPLSLTAPIPDTYKAC
jgi:hypothetical protein